MQTLEDYIKEVNPNFDESIFLEYVSGIYFSQLKYIVTNIKLEKHRLNDNPFRPELLISKSEFCYHNECIDLILEYLIHNKINNVLKLGYTDGSATNSTNKYVFKGYNTSVDFLKSKPMEIIRLILGVKSYINLILNYNAILVPSNCLLWGEYKNKIYNQIKAKQFIHFRYMLFQHSTRLYKTNPVILEPYALLSFMFKFENNEGKKNTPPKRFRKIFKLLKKIISNHKSHMKEYPYIVDQICDTDEKDKNNNFSLCVQKSKVITLVMAIIYKVIPLELFGTIRNRTLIMRHIPKLTNGTTYSKIPISNILYKVKLNEIDWLKPRTNVKMTKPEFIRAKQMFTHFIVWLFLTFISKFVAAFFHVTNASQQNRLLFYRHHIWNRLTKKYLSKYVSEHLINLKDDANSFKNFNENKDLIGRLSLQPKKKSFRLIVKPFKGMSTQKFDYLNYQKRVLKPIMNVLLQSRLMNSCQSISDIITKVYNYKKILLDKYGVLPEIYSYKFDAQSAYDSVPHDIIAKVISKRLDEFSANNEYILQVYHEIDANGNIKGKKYHIVDGVKGLSIPDLNKTSNTPNKKTLVDSHETFRFNKKEIIDFVSKQYKNTCFHTQTRSYYRKIGVFQGFPMSALLFNMVYDSLVEDLYAVTGSVSETTIIRLMDDFLVLSTKASHINKIRKLTARCLRTYNLNINRLKTEIFKNELIFAGLKINISNLICYKMLKDYNNAPILSSSYIRLYDHLMKYAEMRMKNFSLFDESVFKSETIGAKVNVISLFKSIIFKFTNSFKLIKSKDVFNLMAFYQFFNKLFTLVSSRVHLGTLKIEYSDIWTYALKILKHKRILQKK